jgi:hypothetical protein
MITEGRVVGYDYLYFIPRLYEGILFFKAQGFAAPWYSVSFCGGLPFFGDPQTMFYSVPQLFSLIVPPWSAVVWTSAVFLWLGCWGVLLISRCCLKIDLLPAMFAAAAFAGNGFFRSRMVVGHFSYHSYMLLPLIIYLLVERRIRTSLAGVLLGFLGAYFVHSGSHFASFIAIPAVALGGAVLFLFADRRELALPRLIFVRAVVGGAVALLLSLSKLVAVVSFMKNFPRHVKGEAPLSFLQTIQTVLFQLLYPESVPEQHYGIWEYDCSVTLLVFVGVLCLIFGRRKGKQAAVHAVGWERIFAALVALGSFFLTLEVIAGDGVFFSYLKAVPPFESLRATVRFTSVFLLPLCLLAAVGFHRLSERVVIGAVLASIGIVSVVVEPLALSSRYQTYLAFDISAAPRLDERIQKLGDGPHISRLARKKRGDLELMAKGVSNIACLAPNFFRSPARALAANDVYLEEEGYFNFTDPSCFAYPEYRSCNAKTRIPVSDRENFERLLRHKNPDWGFPVLQERANLISKVSFFFAVGMLFVLLVRRGAFLRS